MFWRSFDFLSHCDSFTHLLNTVNIPYILICYCATWVNLGLITVRCIHASIRRLVCRSVTSFLQLMPSPWGPSTLPTTTPLPLTSTPPPPPPYRMLRCSYWNLFFTLREQRDGKGAHYLHAHPQFLPEETPRSSRLLRAGFRGCARKIHRILTLPVAKECCGPCVWSKVVLMYWEFRKSGVLPAYSPSSRLYLFKIWLIEFECYIWITNW